MKRLILVIISSCVMLLAFAQEEISLDSIPKIQRESGINRLSIEKPLLFEDAFFMEEIKLFDQSMLHQPLLPDYTKNLDFKKYLSFSGLSTESFSTTGFGIFPFFTTESIFNQAAYKLNDRLSIGGNSFGAQSVFEQPRINSSIREMSIKGASMFMQYKISNKFKVATSFSITNHQSPWKP